MLDPASASSASATPSSVPASASPAAAKPVTEGEVWAALRTCYDPEIPLNIVELGLVYDVSIREQLVSVRMTLTAPGCPLAGQIVAEVQNKLLAVEAVEEVKVDLVWDPPWNQGMITEAGRLELGLM